MQAYRRVPPVNLEPRRYWRDGRPLSDHRKRLVLVACILGSTVVAVDSTVVNVALPAIRDDLGGGFAGQQWTANAYLITLASLILVGGSLGDVLGERRVFSAGLIGFGVTSLLCAVAPTIEVLVLARALQGVSGALLSPAALAVIVMTFPRDERGKAVGSWTAWGAVGVVIGPLVGGQLVDAASWRWIFAPERAAGAGHDGAGGAGGARAPDRARGHPPIDVAGALQCAAGLAALTFGLVRAPEAGLADPPCWAAGGRRGAAGRVRAARAPHRAPDAEAGAVPDPQLRDRQPPDAVDVRRPVAAVLLPGDLPPGRARATAPWPPARPRCR